MNKIGIRGVHPPSNYIAPLVKFSSSEYGNQCMKDAKYRPGNSYAGHEKIEVVINDNFIDGFNTNNVGHGHHKMSMYNDKCGVQQSSLQNVSPFCLGNNPNTIPAAHCNEANIRGSVQNWHFPGKFDYCENSKNAQLFASTEHQALHNYRPMKSHLSNGEPWIQPDTTSMYSCHNVSSPFFYNHPQIFNFCQQSFSTPAEKYQPHGIGTCAFSIEGTSSSTESSDSSPFSSSVLQPKWLPSQNQGKFLSPVYDWMKSTVSPAPGETNHVLMKFKVRRGLAVSNPLTWPSAKKSYGKEKLFCEKSTGSVDGSSVLPEAKSNGTHGKTLSFTYAVDDDILRQIKIWFQNRRAKDRRQKKKILDCLPSDGRGTMAGRSDDLEHKTTLPSEVTDSRKLEFSWQPGGVQTVNDSPFIPALDDGAQSYDMRNYDITDYHSMMPTANSMPLFTHQSTVLPITNQFMSSCHEQNAQRMPFFEEIR